MEKRSKDDAHYAEYIKQHLGDLLARAIAEIVQNRPTDPIEYLALWLHKSKGMNPAHRHNVGHRPVSHHTAGTSTSQKTPDITPVRPLPLSSSKDRTPSKADKTPDISVRMVVGTNDAEDFIDEDFSNITTYNAAMVHVHMNFDKIPFDLFADDDIF